MTSIEKRLTTLERAAALSKFTPPARTMTDVELSQFVDRLAGVLSLSSPEGDEVKLFLEGVERLKSGRLVMMPGRAGGAGSGVHSAANKTA